MTYTLDVVNVNEALKKGLKLIEDEGLSQDSRNGPVLSLERPLVTTYEFPRQRVLFSQIRKCNPFFHFFESFWILSGSKEVKFLKTFLPRIADFSDDGETLHGAYGHRMRHQFTLDQLLYVVDRLRENPEDRRVLIQLFDVDVDFHITSKDIPCNVMLIPRVVEGNLDLTIINRSNDMIWGAYGANAVHFSYVQEFLACALDLDVGYLVQFSTNTHVYTDFPVTKRCTSQLRNIEDNRYTMLEDVDELSPHLFNSSDLYLGFLADCEILMGGLRGRESHYNTSYFKTVVCPILESFHQHKRREALTALDDCADRAWAINIKEWAANQPM